MVDFINTHPYLTFISIIAICITLTSIVKYITGYKEETPCPCAYCNS